MQRASHKNFSLPSYNIGWNEALDFVSVLSSSKWRNVLVTNDRHWYYSVSRYARILVSVCSPQMRYIHSLVWRTRQDLVTTIWHFCWKIQHQSIRVAYLIATIHRHTLVLLIWHSSKQACEYLYLYAKKYYDIDINLPCIDILQSFYCWLSESSWIM